MGKRMRAVISKVFFALAAIMTISGAAGYFIMSSEIDVGSSIKEVQREFVESDGLRQERVDSANYDDDVEFARGSDIAEARKHFHSSIEEYGIGSLYMPDSNISVPILAGTSEWNLFNGVGTGRADQELGEGLFIALSHNLVNDRLIKNIDQMSPGDFVYASDFTNVFTYQVIDQKVVHETDTEYFQEPVDGDNGKMLIYRCEGESGTEWRRALYSEFVESRPVVNTDINILNGLGIEVDEIDEIDIEYEDLDHKINEPLVEGFLDILISRFVGFVGQYKGLSDYFLSVYSIADDNPIAFGIVTVVLFVMYSLI